MGGGANVCGLEEGCKGQSVLLRVCKGEVCTIGCVRMVDVVMKGV